MANPEPLHPTAVGFTLFRALPDGSGRAYTAVEFTRGWAGADHFRRQLRACGFIRNSSSEPSYGVLDVLDAEGDIVQDYDVPTARAFAYIKRKLKLRVAPEAASDQPGRHCRVCGRSGGELTENGCPTDGPDAVVEGPGS